MTLLDRAGIAKLIAHAGAMCLLDGLLDWDADSVRCVSRRFAQADNPLRRADGTQGAACGIEIAAQAMALHGRLTAGTDGPAVPGMLASLRDVRLAAARLDSVAGELLVEVARLTGDAGGASYRFALSREGEALVSGRATVLFRAWP